MAQDVATSIVNLVSAARGTSGTDSIENVRRLAHRVEGSGRTLPGQAMAADYRKTYAELTVAIETTNESEYTRHQTIDQEEALIVVFKDFNGSVRRTYVRVRAKIGGESLFPPPDEDGPAGVREIQFVALEAEEGEGLETAFYDVAI